MSEKCRRAHGDLIPVTYKFPYRDNPLRGAFNADYVTRTLATDYQARAGWFYFMDHLVARGLVLTQAFRVDRYNDVFYYQCLAAPSDIPRGNADASMRTRHARGVDVCSAIDRLRFTVEEPDARDLVGESERTFYWEFRSRYNGDDGEYTASDLKGYLTVPLLEALQERLNSDPLLVSLVGKPKLGKARLTPSRTLVVPVSFTARVATSQPELLDFSFSDSAGRDAA